MTQPTSFLVGIRQIFKLHENLLKKVCEQHQLTLTEGTIISFLYNNPGRDTAGDIVELRMLSKGNVSQAVESLIQKSLLRRSQDKYDRRKIHLTLLPKAAPITSAVEAVGEEFQRELFSGFSEQERMKMCIRDRRTYRLVCKNATSKSKRSRIPR